MSTSSGKLSNKVAVVTGASKGIGAAIAKELAAAGAAVVVNYSSSKEGADRVVSEITTADGRAVAVQANVANQEDITRLFAETKKAYGRVDILVNNAGIYAFAPLEETTAELFHQQFGLNVLGLLLTTKEAVKLMPDGGSIINISSGVTSILPPNSSVYTGTKGAVDAITGVLAKELAPRKIRVNGIQPGMIATEGVHSAGFLGTDFEKGLVAITPLGRVGQVDDIAPTAVYLASDDSKYMTGENILLTGGSR